MHRVAWDLQYNDPPAFRHDLENQMNMVEHSVTPGPHGMQVIPGRYTLKLTVDGHVYTRTLTVINDPRVGQGPEVMANLRAQNRLNLDTYHAMESSYRGHAQVAALQSQLTKLQASNPPAAVAARAKALDTKLVAVGGKVATGGFFRRGPAPKPGALVSFVGLNNEFNALISIVQVGLDTAPTPAQVATWQGECRQFNQTVTAWNHLQTTDVVAFNRVLGQNHLAPLRTAPARLSDPSCTSSPHP